MTLLTAESLVEPHLEKGSILIGGEPHVVHCHYYNHFLQTSIEDAEGIYPVEEVLVWTAQEVAHALFRNIFTKKGIHDFNQRKSLVESLYSSCGFGKISLQGITSEGGEISTPYEHYAYTYAATFPSRPKGKRGVAYFSQGYIAGAIEAIYDLPLGSIGSEQTACLTQGDPAVRWRFYRLSHLLPLSPSVQEGKAQTGTLVQPRDTRVPMAQIRDAVLGLPLNPDPDTGLIEAFGVVLTRLPGNYYTLISERHFQRMIQVVGEEVRQVVLDMLIESGHVCAFNTLGGIMQSAEWDAVVRPYLDTPEDWIYGISAVLPAIGWGIVECSQRPSAQAWNLCLRNWYETTALAALPSPALDHSPFAKGLFAGIMALVYKAGIAEKSLTFDGVLYRQLFQEGRIYETEFLESRLQGGEKDVLRARVGHV
ncbi:MAG: hypothetical protein RMJ66_06665 [Bacteroidia bacterium]|nr:hypothetical protein [Bacteroidia bacterium]MDW8134734.1 hypothetical protein [Bacteroidia bacterium]